MWVGWTGTMVGEGHCGQAAGEAPGGLTGSETRDSTAGS